MAKTIKVEFIENRVMFINGKRTFCNSGQMKIINKSGEVSKDKAGNDRFKPKKKYDIPSELHDSFVEKGIIKNARKKK